MAKKQKFTVFNATDGFLASPDTFTKEQAEQFVKDFPKRYERQGYYLTSSRERIDPNDVELVIEPVTRSTTLLPPPRTLEHGEPVHDRIKHLRACGWKDTIDGRGLMLSTWSADGQVGTTQYVWWDTIANMPQHTYELRVDAGKAELARRTENER